MRGMNSTKQKKNNKETEKKEDKTHFEIIEMRSPSTRVLEL